MYRALILLTTLALIATASAQTKKKPAPKQENAAPPYRLYNPDTLFKPQAGYSQIAEVTSGKIVFIAGQVPFDKNGTLVGAGDFRAQLTQIFENLKSAVEASGGTFNDVIKINIYVSDRVDANQIPIIREVRDKYINTTAPPTSTLLFVSRLANPAWLSEIDATAVIKK